MIGEFSLGDKHRLDLRWESVAYFDNICLFKGAYFSGPVLQFAEKIEPDNSMELDFFKQYFVLVDNVYIGKFSWKDVVYKEDIVLLSECTLTHKSELHKVPKLEDMDYLVIDCRLHDRETHAFHTNYRTYVANSDSQVYNFMGNK